MNTPQTTKLDAIEIDMYSADDGGILDAWADLYGDEWLYVTGSEIWLQWQNTHWAECKLMGIDKQIKDVMFAMHFQAKSRLADALRAARNGDDNEKAEAKKQVSIHKSQVAAFKRSKNKISSVEFMARLDRTTNAADLDQGNFLNLLNGTLDLDTGDLMPHDHDNYFTYTLPYEFNVDARCPRFEQYLDEVLIDSETEQTDHELVQLIVQYIGYCLTIETKHNAMLWMSGMGANGKSVLIDVIKALLGPLACAIDFVTIGSQGNYDAAGIQGKRVVFSTEAAKSSKINEQLLKVVVGGEIVKTRPIYGKPVEFNSTSKVVWAMNDRPIITDTSDAIWRRMQLVPFERTFTKSEQDKDLGAKLEDELSGILNLALVGLQQLRKDGFTESRSVAAAIAEYRHESNPVEQWLSECTTKTNEPATLSNLAYMHYSAWASNNGRKVVNSTNFGKELKRLKAQKKRVTSGNMYLFSITPSAENSESSMYGYVWYV